MIREMFLALGLTVTLMAAPALAETAKFADPAQYNGTWRIDPKRSNFSDGTFPPTMSLRITMTFKDGTLVYSSINDTRKDAPPSLTDYTTSTDGKINPFANQTRFNQISITQLNDTEFQSLKMKDGDVIVGEFWHFLPDNKTLVRKGIGKNPEGKSRAFIETFVREPK